MKISDRAFVAEGFQSSINLDFDLGNKAKLLEYVPTSDICEVLSSYFDSFENNKNQASFLVGPYGKGKSFITLSILQIACGIYDEEALDTLLARIVKINDSLARKIRSFCDAGCFYVPVIINSDYDNLKQSFMVALRNSMQSYGFDDLVPASSFDTCKEILRSWQNDPTIAQGRLSQCGQSYDLGAIARGLENYSAESYNKFVELYNCVTIGQRFNPLVNEDVPKLFADVSAELRKRGRRGLIVVFDEFSKFLESKSKKLGDDLKFVQDFAEKATRSDQHYQLFLSCIAHKPIGQYGDRNSKISDLLKTVEGRFVTLRFQRGMRENMELIQNAIRKREGFEAFYEAFSKKNAWLFEGINALNLLDDADDFSAFAKGCYPLNPLCAYLLVRISELVAQNERTLFTFVSGNDSNGLKKLMRLSDDNLIDASVIYDYFQELFSGSQDQYIKDACYLAESALKEVKDSLSEKTIKVIALLKILNDPRAIIPSRSTISLALGILPEVLYENIRVLIKEGVIRESETEGTIDFSFAGSKEINAKAELLLSKELRRVRPMDYLNRIYESDYFLPREYNAVNRMVRYCRYCYIDFETFRNIDSFDGLGRLPYDLLILRVLGENLDYDLIKSKTEQIRNRKVVVVAAEKYNHQTLLRLLRYYAAYQKMSESLYKDNAIDAIELVLKECEKEISNLITDAFPFENTNVFYCENFAVNGFSQLVNFAIGSLYSESPLINNELLNRNILTSQYRKTRNDVVDFILEKGVDATSWDGHFAETSAQNTVWRVFVNNIESKEYKIRPVLDHIKALLDQQSDTIEVKKIVDILMDNPFGLRAGPLPLFFAVVISEMNRFSDSSVTLYYRQKEISLDASNLEKAVLDVGDNYFFKVSQGAKEKGDYVSLLIDLFGGKRQEGASSNIQLTLSLFKLWYRNLPQIVRMGSVKEYPVSFNKTDEAFLKELSKYDLNPTEFLFESLPKILKKDNDLHKTIAAIANEKKRLEMMPSTILKNEFVNLSDTLLFGRGSLLAGLKRFLTQFDYHDGDLIGNKPFADFANYVMSSNSYEDATFIKEASPILIGAYFEDWSRGSKELFVERIIDWKRYAETSFDEDNRSKMKEVAMAIEKVAPAKDVSPLVPLLEGKLRSVIDQFGQSISREDVVFTLAQILKDVEGSR